MTRDLPTPEQIMEELASKVAVQIDRRAPVAFKSALDELIRYHRFLLSVNASLLPDGTPFSYADIASGFMPRFPHHNWIRQYRRLFERAADRIGDDDSFIERLTAVPRYLLPRPGDPQQPPGIIASILDLGPMLAHRLEGWVTNRSIAAHEDGEAAGPRLLLAGSDTKAYSKVLRSFVGEWETLLQLAPSIYGWSGGQHISNAECWSSFDRTWPFLSQHLQNSAYLLAVAVWNEDEIGAGHYRDALIQWRDRASYQRANDAELLNRRLLFPDVLGMDWTDAVAYLGPNMPDYAVELVPQRLFSSLLREVHRDCILVTVAVLLSWHMYKKLPSDIGARTASALLRREVADADEDRRREQRAEFGFRSVFLDVMRIELAGERFSDDGYSKELDRLASSLDGMSERPVVSGRIYTPSTMHDREGLQPAMLAVLLALVPLEGDGGLNDRVTRLLQNEAALPDGDRSLRSLLHLLGFFVRTLDAGGENLRRGAMAISANVEFDAAVSALRSVIQITLDTIKQHRQQRLEERPVDQKKLERIRGELDDALLTPPAKIPFFRGFELRGGAETAIDDAIHFDLTGISKGELVEPPMEPESGNLVEVLADAACRNASVHIWRQFIDRPRESFDVSAPIEDEAFWRIMVSTATRVGPDPVLLVSEREDERILRRFVYSSRKEPPQVKVERKPHDEVGGHYGSYIATIEDIGVYGTQLPTGRAWLFSARLLRAVIYDAIDGADRHVHVRFEGEGEGAGVLRVRYKQSVRWADDPILEIRMPAPEAEDDPGL